MRADTTSETFWNGEPAAARKVTLTVADNPDFPAFWGRELVGQTRNAVEVVYNGETFYLDDDADPRDPRSGAGAAWGKVTAGHGSPAYGHRGLTPEPGSVRPR